ncbi:hypothetical protein Droror1_Dr00017276 [Drosera rotundifolia]
MHPDLQRIVKVELNPQSGTRSPTRVLLEYPNNQQTEAQIFQIVKYGVLQGEKSFDQTSTLPSRSPSRSRREDQQQQVAVDEKTDFEHLHAPDPEEADIRVPLTIPEEAKSPRSQATEEFGVTSSDLPNDVQQHTIAIANNLSTPRDNIFQTAESRLKAHEERIKKMLEESEAQTAQQIATAVEKMSGFDFRLR